MGDIEKRAVGRTNQLTQPAAKLSISSISKKMSDYSKLQRKIEFFFRKSPLACKLVNSLLTSRLLICVASFEVCAEHIVYSEWATGAEDRAARILCNSFRRLSFEFYLDGTLFKGLSLSLSPLQSFPEERTCLSIAVRSITAVPSYHSQAFFFILKHTVNIAA